jgi:hypothetical protein
MMSQRINEEEVEAIYRELHTNKVKNKDIKHYELWRGVEAIDIIKTILTKDEYIGFLKGNCLKYRLRAGKKDDINKELAKANDYENELKGLLNV